MKPRRATGLLVEPPTSATGDIAFNLIVFFLVCASVSPDSGRPQTIPRSEKTKQEKQKREQIEVALTRTAVTLNGNPIRKTDFPARIGQLLANKRREQDRVVILKSKPDTTYQHWISISAMIEEAGGIITVQREEERKIQVQ